jgi:hypothetical protein
MQWDYCELRGNYPGMHDGFILCLMENGQVTERLVPFVQQASVPLSEEAVAGRRLHGAIAVAGALGWELVSVDERRTSWIFKRPHREIEPATPG